MSIGSEVLRKIYEVNPHVGDQDGERVQDLESDAFGDESERLWTAIGEALLGGIAKEKQAMLYDGTSKASNGNHVDNFILESEFRDGQDYVDYRENKTDTTKMLINTSDIGSAPSFDDTAEGYRVVINDSDIRSNSVILYSIIAMEPNDTNDLPAGYPHISPRGTYIIHQDNGQMQIFFERKACYILRYMIREAQLETVEALVYED